MVEEEVDGEEVKAPVEEVRDVLSALNRIAPERLRQLMSRLNRMPSPTIDDPLSFGRKQDG